MTGKNNHSKSGRWNTSAGIPLCILSPGNRKKTKKGLKLFPIDQPEVVEVGYKIGSALRAAYLAEQVGGTVQEDTGGRKQPRPHVRKSHWHSFWKGPIEGERQIFVKWLPPIPVNIDQDGGLPVTIKKVKR